jgi:hypothetical protein
MSIALPQITAKFMLPFDTEKILHQFAALPYGDVVCPCVVYEFICGREKINKFHTFRLQSPPPLLR